MGSLTNQALSWVATIDTRSIETGFAIARTTISNNLNAISNAIMNSRVAGAVRSFSTQITASVDALALHMAPTNPRGLRGMLRVMRDTPAEMATAMNTAAGSLARSTNATHNAASTILTDIAAVAARSQAAGRSVSQVGHDVERFMNSIHHNINGVVMTSADVLRHTLATVSPETFGSIITGLRGAGLAGSDQLLNVVSSQIAARQDVQVHVGRMMGSALIQSMGSAVRIGIRVIIDPFRLVASGIRVVLGPVAGIIHHGLVQPAIWAARQIPGIARTAFHAFVTSAHVAVRGVNLAFRGIRSVFRIRVHADVQRAHAGFRGLFGFLHGGILGLSSPLLAITAPIYLFRKALAPLLHMLENSLMPLFVPLQDKVASLMLSVQPMIVLWIPRLQDEIAKLMPTIVAITQRFMGFVGSIVKFVQNSPAIISTLKLIVAGIVAYTVATQAARAVTVLFRVAMMALNATPIGMIALALVGLVYGFNKLFNDVKGGTLTFTSMWGSVVSLFKTVKDAFMPFAISVKDFLVTIVVPGAINFIKSLVEWIGQIPVRFASLIATVKWVLSSAVTEFKATFNTVVSLFSGSSSSIGKVLNQVGGYLLQILQPVVSLLRVMFTGVISLWGGIRELLVGLGGFFRHALGGLFIFLKGLSPVFQGIRVLIQGIGNALEPILTAIYKLANTLMRALAPALIFIGGLFKFVFAMLTPVVRIIGVFFYGLTKILGPALHGIGHLIGWIIDGVGFLVKAIGKGFGLLNDIFGWIFSKMMEGMKALPTWMKKAINWLFGIEIDGVKLPPAQPIVVKPVAAAPRVNAPTAQPATVAMPAFDAMAAPAAPADEMNLAAAPPEGMEFQQAAADNEQVVKGLAMVGAKADTTRVVVAINQLIDVVKGNQTTASARDKLNQKDISPGVMRVAFVS